MADGPPPPTDVKQLIQALEIAARAPRIKNLPNLVEQGIARQHAEQGVAICTAVDFEAIHLALKDTRRVINKFILVDFEDFRDSLPSVVRAGKKAALSSAKALETLVQGHAHLQDHRQQLSAQAAKFKQQAEAERVKAAQKWKVACRWWWASAAVSFTGVGAVLWAVHGHYAGQTSEAYHKAATLEATEHAFVNILDPAFQKFGMVFLLSANYFGEQKNRLEDFVEAGQEAQQGPGSELHQYFYSMKTIMKEVYTALSHFETGLLGQVVAARPNMDAICA